MTRKISSFSVFCIVAAILSTLYLLTYHFVLADMAAVNYDTRWTNLCTLVFVPLFWFSLTGAVTSVLTGQWLKTPPAALRMLLLLLPVLFLIFYAAFTLLNLMGSLPLSMVSTLVQMGNPVYFALSGILFSFGILR